MAGLRLSEKEAHALLGDKLPPRPPKYHNKPGRLDGIGFDSQQELLRYAYLVQVEMANQIVELQVHPTFDLFAHTPQGPAACVGSYEADFSYITEGEVVIEDVKGMLLPLYQLKREIFLVNYPMLIFQEVRQCRRRWKTTVLSQLSLKQPI